MRFANVPVLLFGGIIVCGLLPNGAAAQWERFRGPGGQGNADRCTLPSEFSMEQHALWRTELPGKGWSSPVVAGEQVWVTTAIAQEATAEEVAARLAREKNKDLKEVAGTILLRAICIDWKTGRILHDVALGEFGDPDPINPLNSFASPTPVIDNGRVFCHFGNYGTWCLDASTGKVIWKTQVVVDHSVGPGSSPIVYGPNLILVCDGIDAQFVVSLNASDGQQRWKTKRPPVRAENVEMHKAYTTPIVIEVEGKTQIVTPTAQWICAYDPSDGKEIWRAEHGDGFSTSPSAIYWKGLVVFSTGYMRPELVAVKPTGQGDVTQTHIAWRSKRGAPNKPSPIGVGDYLYAVSDTGIVTQWDVNGNERWQERLGGNFSASPIESEGRLFVMSHESMVTVFEAGGGYRELGRSELAGEGRLMASPAIVDGDLLIRSEKSLMRLSSKK